MTPKNCIKRTIEYNRIFKLLLENGFLRICLSETTASKVYIWKHKSAFMSISCLAILIASVLAISIQLVLLKTFSILFEVKKSVSLVEQVSMESKEQDFGYLGSWTGLGRDVQNRKVQAWQVLNKLEKTADKWPARLVEDQIFMAAVETIFLYGCATWSLTKTRKIPWQLL